MYCTLASGDGRIEAEYDLPPGRDNPYTEYVRSDEWELRESTLHRRDGDYYLHIGVRKEPDDDYGSQAGNGTVLGVDCGIVKIAVTSTGRFFGGGLPNHRREEYERLRGKIQQCGTESAHKSIKSMGERESRWNEDPLHRISKAIAQEAIAYECSTIAFENLTDIRDRIPGANAAKNVGYKNVRSGQKRPTGRATYQLPLKSGTLNASGSFSPTDAQPGRIERESTGKSRRLRRGR